MPNRTIYLVSRFLQTSHHREEGTILEGFEVGEDYLYHIDKISHVLTVNLPSLGAYKSEAWDPLKTITKTIGPAAWLQSSPSFVVEIDRKLRIFVSRA